jgi:hypothetical protein
MSSTGKRALAMFLGVAGVAAASAPRPAEAQEANGFGEKYQLILGVDRLMPALSYTSQTVTSTQGGNIQKSTDSGTSMAVLLGREPSLGVVHTMPRVAFDFTIVRHLTLGGSFAFAFGLGGSHEDDFGNNTTRKSDSPKTTIIGFAPRVGYIVPLGRLFAFWPRAGFAYYSVSTKTSGFNNAGNVTSTTISDSVFSLDLDPQFVWTPIRHFFINFGPLVNIPLTGSRSIESAVGPTSGTTKNDLSVFHFGLSAGLGGWFDL